MTAPSSAGNLVAIVAVPILAGLALAVSIVDRPRPVAKPKVHDVPAPAKDASWTLDFRFKNPRIVTSQEPGRSGRPVCYLWYQVTNKTDGPRTFIPEFSLVVGKGPNHRDTILPKAFEAIRRTEDPTGQAGISDSITISRQPLISCKGKAALHASTGVATWEGEPAAKEITILVAGLSSKVAVLRDGIYRQTLQLQFRRQAKEFVFVPPATWVMRDASK